MKRSRGRPKKKVPEFANNRNELAHYLGVDRRTINRWLEQFKDDPDPPPLKHGDRYHIPSWKAWVERHNLKQQPKQTGAGEAENDEQSKAHWDRQSAKLKFERDSFAFEVEKQKHISIDEITAAIGQMLAGFRTALNMLPGSAARWLIGLKDFHAIKNKLQSEVDGVLQALGRCRYLEELAPAVVEKHFTDRDENFRRDIASAISLCLGELGRLALSDLLQRELPAPEVPQKSASESSAKAPPKPEPDSVEDAQSRTPSDSAGAKSTRQSNLGTTVAGKKSRSRGASKSSASKQ